MSGVFIVCPTLRRPHPRCEESLTLLRDTLNAEGVSTPPVKYSSVCPLYLARSMLADRFLESTASVMLSVDDDTSFRLEDAKAIVGPVLDGIADFTGASYGPRRLSMKALRESAKDDSKSDIEVLEDAAPLFCGQMTDASLTGNGVKGFYYADHFLMEVDWVGGGMFCISRRCVEALLTAYQGMLLFDNAINADGIWQSDDIVIGNRWKAIGGVSYFDAHSRLIHWGEFGYRAAFDRRAKEEGFAFIETPPRAFDVDMRLHPQAIRNARHPGILLRAMREKAGLTREQLAEALKVPPSYVHNVEGGGIALVGALAMAWKARCGVDVA